MPEGEGYWEIWKERLEKRKTGREWVEEKTKEFLNLLGVEVDKKEVEEKIDEILEGKYPWVRDVLNRMRVGKKGQLPVVSIPVIASAFTLRQTRALPYTYTPLERIEDVKGVKEEIDRLFKGKSAEEALQMVLEGKVEVDEKIRPHVVNWLAATVLAKGLLGAEPKGTVVSPPNLERFLGNPAYYVEKGRKVMELGKKMGVNVSPNTALMLAMRRDPEEAIRRAKEIEKRYGVGTSTAVRLVMRRDPEKVIREAERIMEEYGVPRSDAVRLVMGYKDPEEAIRRVRIMEEYGVPESTAVRLVMGYKDPEEMLKRARRIMEEYGVNSDMALGLVMGGNPEKKIEEANRIKKEYGVPWDVALKLAMEEELKEALTKAKREEVRRIVLRMINKRFSPEVVKRIAYLLSDVPVNVEKFWRNMKYVFGKGRGYDHELLESILRGEFPEGWPADLMDPKKILGIIAIGEIPRKGERLLRGGEREVHPVAVRLMELVKWKDKV